MKNYINEIDYRRKFSRYSYYVEKFNKKKLCIVEASRAEREKKVSKN
jgi:hypothetical protein